MARSSGKGHHWYDVRTLLVWSSVSIVVMITALARPVFGARTDSNKAEADRLIAAAVQAEISGDYPRSLALLHTAAETDPQNKRARWHLGQVQLDGQWVAVEELQRRAAADPRQAEYREARSICGDDPQAQLALARWCRKNHLDDEGRFHWSNVLSVNPRNLEAQRALEMRWHNGRLMSKEEYAAFKSAPESRRRRERWTASVNKWRNSLTGKNDIPGADTLAEIRAIRSADAVPVIEELTLNSDMSSSKETEARRDISMAFIAALEKMPEQAATESLMRHAVWSALSDVRYAATDRLKNRSSYDYVPLLLDGLSMPVESSYHIETFSNGSVHYAHTFYREGATANYSSEVDHEAIPYFTQKVDPGDSRKAATRALRAAKVGARAQIKFSDRAAAVESKVENVNQAGAWLDERIIAVLTKTTGKELGADPRKWWEWWQKQNELFVPDKKMVYQTQSTNLDHKCCSCFVKGTPIWTKTGLRPVESLELGDLVLAQDVNTGELKYEPVIGRTLRPPSEILKLVIGSEELRATLGHPFWVAGTGWQMTKELKSGAKLHGVNWPSGIRSIEPADQAEAYNLVVADFNTYFVGESGILVHDNTVRRPTRAMVPGVIGAASK